MAAYRRVYDSRQLPRTGISFGTLRSVIEYRLPSVGYLLTQEMIQRERRVELISAELRADSRLVRLVSVITVRRQRAGVDLTGPRWLIRRFIGGDTSVCAGLEYTVVTFMGRLDVNLGTAWTTHGRPDN